MWMEVRPSPMNKGTSEELTPMFLGSVTAEMMRSRRAVPSIWSIARVTNEICRQQEEELKR
jgi:hypothetical protein